jgi:hypothetical protein
MSKEIMKQALEALKMCRGLIRNNIAEGVAIRSPNPFFSADVDNAITALRTAIEQAEKQEPVVTGKGLRRLHDEMEPLATMEDEEQVSAWWKHFAGKVRLELKRNTSQPQQAQKPVVTKISANGSFLHPAWDSVPIGTPLYTTPQPQRELNCVCGAVWEGDEMVCVPRKREWVGLTDEEMHECWDSPLTPLGMKHVRMIEAKLKEKNGG